jgi:hypothetical protein
MGFLDRAAALLSRSVFEGKQTLPGWAIDSPIVTSIREALGGNLTPPPRTRLEWFLEEVDIASEAADMGDMSQAAQLCRAMRRDPVISGLLATKSGGITRLPKKWYGSPKVISALTDTEGGTPVFDLLCPPTELRKLADDADFLKIAVAELVPVKGRSYPVLERKDPEALVYLWNYNQWCFRSTAGILPIMPGDGRWVLHFAGPRIAPWQDGNWHSLGRSWVRKDSMQHLKQNWAFHLANAARVAVAPQGSTKEQRANWFRQIASWGINSVFHTTPGWDVKLLESNGRGWEGFDTSIEDANKDFMIQLAGQLVSITGGTGFSSEDLYATVRYDLIEEAARPLAHTVSTQVIPWFTYQNHPDEFEQSPGYVYDVKRPDDLSKEASIYTALGAGVKALEDAARQHGLQIDVAKVFARYGLDVTKRPEGNTASARLTLAPTDLAKVFTVDEVRASQGYGPIGDDRGKLTLQELTDSMVNNPEELVQAGEVTPIRKPSSAKPKEPTKPKPSDDDEDAKDA